MNGMIGGAKALLGQHLLVPYVLHQFLN